MKLETKLGLLVFSIVAILRIPFINGDNWNPGFLSYGFYATDEGEYTNGGRNAYLFGKYYLEELDTPETLKFSPGMHLLAHLSYKVFGLKWFTARVPSVLFACVGWLSIFLLCSRFTHPGIAAAVTILCSLNPVSLTYERLASTDVVVGALAVLSCYLITTKSRPDYALAGFFIVFALSVKLTFLGLLPLIVLWCLVQRRNRSVFRWLFLGFAVTSIAYFIFWKAVIQSSTISTSVTSVVRVMDFNLLKAAWSVWTFPRANQMIELGPMVLVLCLGIPLYLIYFYKNSSRFVSRNNAIFLGVAFYLVILATQRVQPLRYFVPVLFFMPVLLIQLRRLFKHFEIPLVYLLGSGAALICIFWVKVPLAAVNNAYYLGTEYNIPEFGPSVWKLAAGFFVLIAVFIFSSIKSGKSPVSLKTFLVPSVLAFCIAKVFMNHTAFSQSEPNGYFLKELLILQVLVLAFVFVSTRIKKSWMGSFVAFAGAILIYANASYHWRMGYTYLLLPTNEQRELAQKIQDKLPSNSIIIGRRSTTFFRSSIFPLGLTNSSYSPEEFAARISKLMGKYPNNPIVWIVDAEDSHQWDALNKANPKHKIKKIGTIKLPSEYRPELESTYLYGLSKDGH